MYFLRKSIKCSYLIRFPNEEEAKAKAEFGLQAGFTMKFSAIQNNLKDKYSTTS